MAKLIEAFSICGFSNMAKVPSQSPNHPIIQSITQSIIQSTNHPINHSIIQSTNQPITQSPEIKSWI